MILIQKTDTKIWESQVKVKFDKVKSEFFGFKRSLPFDRLSWNYLFSENICYTFKSVKRIFNDKSNIFK